MYPEIKTFEDAMKNNSTVHKIMRYAEFSSISTEEAMRDCITCLANIQNQLMNRIMKLDIIAPKKYRLEDGTIAIWRCPSELIPYAEGSIPVSNSTNETTPNTPNSPTNQGK